MENSGQSDEELAARVQAGDHDAFAVLLERYEIKLLRYGKKFLSNPQDIEDLVQDVFLSAYKNIQSFDRSQKFSPWIYRIAHNRFVDQLKKISRTPILYFDFDTLFVHPIHDEQAESEREQREMRDMIETGLGRVPEKYREILILHYLEDLKYKDISEILRVPIGTVAVRLKRAKDALREVYKKMNLNYGK